jgi:hypothetical protein
LQMQQTQVKLGIKWDVIPHCGIGNGNHSQYVHNSQSV